MRFYLDHAATTPLRPEAREAWLLASDVVGNAASTHAAGQAARRLLEESRERLAAVVDCDPVEVVFTSGGTESINTALRGLWAARGAGVGRIVLPDGEHHATMDTVEALHREGAEVVSVPLDAHGGIRVAAFSEAVSRTGVALATAIAANNEVGTINDVAALADAGAAAHVPVHVDAVAAFGHEPVSFRGWRGDAASGVGLVAVSITGHKIGAPVGVGALVVARTAQMAALLHGGSQQRGLRAGTQDVAGAAALAAAAEYADKEREAESARLASLRDRLVLGIRAAVPAAELLGDPTHRLPGNAHFLFPGGGG